MADKYTIQVQPQITPADGQKMEFDLNRRFANVSKKFGTHLKNSVGSGLKTAFKIGVGGAIAGAAGALLSNPYKEIDEKLNQLLEKSDNLSTRANQFGVPTAKFAKLAAIAGSVGLDVDLALQQFSGAMEEARQYVKGDKTKNNALVNFVNEKDVVDAFFAFAKEMAKLNGDSRGVEVSKIYGDKLVNKMAEFFQLDLDKRQKQAIPKGYTEKQYGEAIDKLAQREDEQAVLRMQRESMDFIKKSRVVTKGTIKTQDAVERAKQAKDTQQLSEYEIYAKQMQLQEQMATSLDGIRADLVSVLLPVLQKCVEYLAKMIDWLREIVAAIKKLKFWG